MIIPDDHVLVRALHFPFWNGEFATKSAFEKADVSVSSANILPMEDIIRILKHDLEIASSNPVKIEAIAKITAGKVREVCLEPAAKLDAKVDVVHAPINNSPPWADNAAHCEIRASDPNLQSRKLTTSMAKVLLKNCKVEKL